MSQWQLAQLNIARAVAPLDDPIMAGFTGQLDAINLLAEQSPGFVWRLQSESGNATDIAYDSDPLLIANMSVWTSLAALRRYVYTGEHLALLKQRKAWFSKHEGPTQVLWWIRAGHIPALSEGQAALEILRLNGSTPLAFTFAQPFSAPKRQTHIEPVGIT
ncbi:DUF3291 domain-containing protein [Chitinibacter fontanus]|uniref:DUF3291 domain-containing protein n=1 Tax=Chitinibacter fontanus TaxID=1737446 RepID=A0A7D5Z5U3_9NEIS|nr:DUF3291 domain-containing protein [Chitinibacter fontanus]QLI81463.1 DUF3291 domain-containing protein [Chitinibacter fontanus]